jgi:hypothetical protein
MLMPLKSSSLLSQYHLLQQGHMEMELVFSLIKNNRMLALQDFGGNLLPSMGWKAVHHDHIRLSQTH